MSTWHIDPECEAAIIRLNDALCSFERITGRRYTLIIVPEQQDELIHISQDGKPLPLDAGVEPEEILEVAMQYRRTA